MKKFRMPKINSIHFGAIWIGISIIIGILLPAVIWMITDTFYWGFSLIGGIILLGFIVVFIIEMRQDFGKKHVCEDKTLFVGDATCAQFPDGAKDKKLANKLADKIRLTGAVTCVEGHWQPVETEDTLRDLLG